MRGHDVELLAAQFVDHMQRTAAAGAVAVFDVDQHLVTRQVCRQCAVVAVGLGVGPPLRLVPARIRRVLPGLLGGDTLFQILDPEL